MKVSYFLEFPEYYLNFTKDDTLEFLPHKGMTFRFLEIDTEIIVKEVCYTFEDGLVHLFLECKCPKKRSREYIIKHLSGLGWELDEVWAKQYRSE